MVAIALCYAVVTAALMPAFAFLALVVTAAAVGPPRRPPGSSRRRLLVVIPAHDEETTIRRTVQSCLAISYDPALFSVLVIADNCSDRTAAIARESGAQVHERTDDLRRSKGYAIEDLTRSDRIGGYDAVVIIDADTDVDPSLLTEFAAGLDAGFDWMQGYSTVRNPDASWRTRMMTYALSLFNGVWLQGTDGLGLSVALRGNGMCLSTRGLQRVPWQASGLTEDLEFSWVLRLAGERVRFVPRACVHAEQVSRGGEVAANQRRRWEIGRQQLRGQFRGPLLASRQIPWARKILYLIDLHFPPLVGLLLVLLVACTVAAAAWYDPGLAGLARVLRPIHLAMLAVFVLYALSPIVVMRLPARYLLSLAALPYYVVWKVAAMLGRKPTAWIRTRREVTTGEGSTP